ncbi:MAG: CBS domain-containing protein [Chloroflexi bacterium]|nr:CBS domain-containing protein [Chloroflexota bacterium]
MTHENADFDAIASLLGASKLFPGAVPLLPRRVNRNCLDFLALYGAELPLIDQDDRPHGRIDRAILVDTQGLNMLKGMARDTVVDVIDHHGESANLPSGWTYSGEPLGATTTLLVEAISARGLRMSSIEATLLMLGIYEDTGSLLYESTTARDIRASAWLLERGARLAVVDKFLHHPLTPGQRELYELLMEQSETHEVGGHTIVIACAAAHGVEEEISTLAHRLRELLEPAALFVLVDLGGRIQLVARSTTDDVDVAVLAAQFGGGGHSRAAAALIEGRRMDTVREELLDMLPSIVRPSTQVSEIMSRGVQVLQADETIAAAAHRMRRTGHEGYPIVQDGKVIGLLTRRDVDRALQFEMGDAAVSQVMNVGSISVSPNDSVERLRALMIESGWGQIPVVEQDEIVGVVTRTDLITLWGAPPQASQRQDVGHLLENALSPPVLSLVHRISVQSRQMGVVPHFVGGLVRDLLLGHPIVDIDLVIEGDAIALARQVSADLGGRVRSHRQFGTAKWLLSERVWRQLGAGSPTEGNLPKSIDFVTARTEFYTHPTALPEVETSSIKPDLQRRDFTINTLAIRLDPEHWGELLDFYGGESDLTNGIIRVMHSLSFVDDPTRMLRAARLEARLGFQLDPHSERLINNALPLVRRVSGPRILHELELIFNEAEPERALSRLDQLGILRHIQSDLRYDNWIEEKYTAVRRDLDTAAWYASDSSPQAFLHMALLVYRLDSESLDQFIERLHIRRDEAQALRQSLDLRQILPALRTAKLPSEIDSLLSPYPASVLAIHWIAVDDALTRQRLLRYQFEWRHVQSEITGEDLIGMGLHPSPQFGSLLRAVRAARLDGQVSSREEEIDMVRKLLHGEGSRSDSPQRTDCPDPCD